MFKTGYDSKKPRMNLEEYFNKTPDIMKQREKMTVEMAKELEKTRDTKGWKEIIEPFLKKEGNPAKILDKDTRKDESRVGQINAYYRFISMMDNFQNFLDNYRKETKQTKR